MPNTVYYPRTLKYVEITCYLLLLLFIVPIKINNNHYEDQFVEYLKKFNKTYDDPDLFQKKFQAFKDALQNIDILNANRTNNSALYGLTKFSDMLPEEFAESHLMTNFSYFLKKDNKLFKNDVQHSKRSVSFDLPKVVDWRLENVVGPIQRQEDCGACWAFAAVGLIESMYAIKTGKFESLSIQEMIDCSENNDGCEGGDICVLLNWTKLTNITLVKEEEYPLLLTKGTCKKTSSKGVHIQDFDCSSLVNYEDIILALLARHGPVAVAINAKSWQHYVGGVIQFHCNNDHLKLNHAVELVGYDLTGNIPYYIVRNSWGEDFGDKGYLYIAIGRNLCGLAHEVSSVEVL